MIRAYRDGDASALASLHTAIFPADLLTTADFQDLADSALQSGGSAWTIVAEEVSGYALAAPVPGLPHIADLKGCIAPNRQRRGYGSALLRRVLDDLRATAVRQLTYMTANVDEQGARFLRKRGFALEHEEWLMLRDLNAMPVSHAPEGVRLITVPREEAIGRFQQLYAASFAVLPWHQPYSLEEMRMSLGNAADILFLERAGTPIGFAWLHLENGGLGVIEPVGILPQVQGQGYGRYLITAALHELAARGAVRAQIGAWRSNQAAIQLYQSLGFRHRQTFSFLAYDLD